MNVRYVLTTVAIALLMVGCGAPTVQTVARVDNVILSRPDLDARVKRVQDGQAKQQQAQQGQQAQQAPPPAAPREIEKNLVELFVQQNLVLNIAKQRNVATTDKEVDDQIAQFRTRIETGPTKLNDVVQSQLGFADENSTEFRQFVSSIIAQQKLGDTLVTTDTVRQEIETMIKAEADKKVKEFHSAHILFAAGNPQAGTPPTDAEWAAALAKANAAEERLGKGEDFATLAKELSDDPGSKDKGGEYDWQKQGSFVPEYEKIIFDGSLKPGEYTKTPVKSQFGYHIIKLLEPTRETAAIPPEQVPQMIDQQVQQELGQRRGAAVQKLVEDERAKAKKEGRLEEPDYTEPTAAPGANGTAAPADGSNAAPTAAPAGQPTAQP